jgi:4-amino-4-deoxy-L-arabinose transferase-like glycosyltransferase
MSRVRAEIALVLLLAILSLPDLFSPPISPTIFRQTQTYAQTLHFIDGGFAPRALAIDVDGPRPLTLVYEFPLYHAIVGTLFKAFGPSFFWGKLVSLIAALAALWIFVRVVREAWGGEIAAWAGLFAASSPIVLLMSTAFQPDMLALALTAAAVALAARWHRAPAMRLWLAFLALLSLAALAKFTVVLPFVPLLLMMTLRTDSGWRTPTAEEAIALIAVVVAPFAAWTTYRGTLMASSSFAFESRMFFIGDLTRFLHAALILKLALIVGAMAMCIAGIPLALLGITRADAWMRALLAGALLYYVLIPTAAEQTYYALPIVPLLALLMAHGAVRLEQWGSPRLTQYRVPRAAILTCWCAGFAVAAPYTLRHDDVSLQAAQAVSANTQPRDLIFVMNMHDRGVGIGGTNPTIVTLAGRRGWNVQFESTDADRLTAQIDARRADGARVAVATWFTPDLDPWFARFLPQSLSRRPRVNGVAVDGRGIAEKLSQRHRVVSRGANFVVWSFE